jgi:aminomethyltransferase
MPVQYAGVIDETRAVRAAWGVFDVSHMGQFDLSGPGCTSALDRIVSAKWAGLEIGRVAYALLLNEAGGVIDDIMGYRRGADEWLIVANAGRAEADERHLREALPPGLFTGNRYADQAMLAVQGPHAEVGLAAALAALGLPSFDLAAMRWRDFDCRGGLIVARGGYTGCDGFEIMCDAAGARSLWRALLEQGCAPAGLAARDALRLEAALPLYGHELNETWTPYESGCGFAVAPDKPAFIGRDAVIAHRVAGRRIRALKMEGKAIAREGYAVHQGGVQIGQVTSGSYSPTLGAGIALAMVPATVAIGDTVEVVVRDREHPARVVRPPFVPSSKK